jgi:glycosyltransferase involved in cell wall biosynthesis
MSLVSVIMPTYNRPKLLRRAIESVLVQSFTDYEIIVVDDCSTDDAEAVVTSFNDKRIRYIKLDKNSGGSMLPRRVGIKEANSKYIAILDDDDFWVDIGKLALQVVYLETHPKCMLVGTDAITVSGEGFVKMHHHYPKTYQEIRGKLLIYNCFYHSSVMYRKETIERMGGYKAVNGRRYKYFSNDYDLWLRMGIEGEVVNLPIYGVGHVYSPSNLSAKDRMYYMMQQVSLIGDYKKYYRNYFIAGLVKCFFSLIELPLLRTAKNGIINIGKENEG